MQPRRVLIQNLGSGLMSPLVDELVTRSHQVVCCQPEAEDARTPAAGAVEVHPLDRFRQVVGGHAPFDAVVFDAPTLNEGALVDAALNGADSWSVKTDRFANAVGAAVKTFLADVRATLKELVSRGQGQVWILGVDDSFGYFLDMPIAPITTHARLSCLRSLSKEYACMGIAINALIIQPPVEMAGKEAFRARRDGLKAYSLRYRPMTTAQAAKGLADYLDREMLPMNGAVVTFGTGVTDIWG